MIITFVLQGRTTVPVGGFKIIYEYANRLVERGHIVNLVHPLDFANEHGLLWREYIRLRRSLGTLVRGEWFQLHRSVNFLITPTLEERFIPDADIIIATCWPTATSVNDYSPQKGVKFNLIQQYEGWCQNERHVDRTWKFDMKKIVVAKWLKAVAEGMGETATWVTNAIDTGTFTVKQPIESRDPYAIGMLYHTTEWKGFADGLEAMSIAAQKYPQISLNLFGAYRKPKNLPSWVSYVRRPSARALVNLYNSMSIFVHTSWIEGWGLTPAEAMSCGCAVVATDSKGVLDYAEDGRNALLSPPRDPERLAANIIRLIENREQRIKLAIAGHKRIKEFTWDRAIDSFECALLNP